MSFPDSIGRIQTLAQEIRRAKEQPAAVMVEMAIGKLQSADFCAERVSEVPRGSVEDRTYAECCVYFLKSALDCTAESTNLRFKLGLTRPEYSASMEIIEREWMKVKLDLQTIGRTELIGTLESVLQPPWYKDLKWLRDAATHHGRLRHGFELGGTTYLKGPGGSDRDLPVRQDLRRFVQATTAAVLSVARLLV
jgi:hypothetical protein